MQQVGWHPDVGLLFPKSVVKEPPGPQKGPLAGLLILVIYIEFTSLDEMILLKTDCRDNASLLSGLSPRPMNALHSA